MMQEFKRFITLILCCQRSYQTHSSSEDYHDRLKRLVVEETLYSTVAALEAFQEKKTQLMQKDRVRIHVTGDRSNTNRPWFEAYSYEPLTPWNRKHLRAGSVFVMIPDGGQYDKDDLIFGVIRLGSERSQYCKCDRATRFRHNRVKCQF